MEIEIALHGRQIDHAEFAQAGGVVRLVLRHGLGGALQDAADAGFTDEHVVRFFHQHEARGAGERIETGFGERRKLELAVSVGEESEHEKRQPVRRLLVECAEDARIVGIARTPLQQRLGFFAAIAPEIRVQEIDHGPQVAPFLDVDLEQVAQIIERRAGESEVALLLDGGGLGVALGDDDAAERRAIFPRHFLPRRLALVRAEADVAAGLRGIEKDSPAVVRHFHVIEMRPAGMIDAYRSAQIDIEAAAALRPHFFPPVEEARLPMLERALQRLVRREVDVIGNFLAIVDGHHCAFAFRFTRVRD